MKIKNYLKLKKSPILFLLCLGIFALSAPLVLAGEIKYTPNIAIPGSSIFGGGQIIITPNTFAEYIKAIYRYAGIMAGAFAMFMLVYGAWQWLMAAGNASKITMAKETVSTTLIGLAFLFGGYLLLSQISVNLVRLQPLVAETPIIVPDTIASCEEQVANYPCGSPFTFEYFNPRTQASSTVSCRNGYKCDDAEKTCQFIHTEGGISVWWACKQDSANCMCRAGEAGEIVAGQNRFR